MSSPSKDDGVASAAPMERKKKRLGCLAQALLAGALLLAGLTVILWPFADRTRRANNFGNYIKEGFTIPQVFAGPREWNFLWAHCRDESGKEQSVHVVRHEEHCEARREGETTLYPDFDAVVAAMAAGQGPFRGLRSLHLVYKFYVPTRIYILFLGPNGRVAKIEQVSRS